MPSAPEISVVIPCLNEEGAVGSTACLAGLDQARGRFIVTANPELVLATPAR